MWTSAWHCPLHGPVAPLQPVRRPGAESLELVLSAAQVPVWVPWPLPSGWVITGFAEAGDERSGSLAVAVALSGPAPLGGVGELLIVAEDPGIGLGARLAGLEGPDPGDGFDSGPPHDHVRHDGHEIALWSVDAGKECAVYVGEAMASWMWFLLAPSDTGLMMCELSTVRDLRDRRDGGAALEPPFGALSPFLDGRLRPMNP
ncbi:hypothetical protein GCM10027294_15820 [Marinactinospora endophytica]